MTIKFLQNLAKKDLFISILIIEPRDIIENPIIMVKNIYCFDYGLRKA